MHTVQPAPDPGHRATQLVSVLSYAGLRPREEWMADLAALLPNLSPQERLDAAHKVAIELVEAKHWQHLGGHTHPVTEGWGWRSGELTEPTEGDDEAFAPHYFDLSKQHRTEAFVHALTAVLVDITTTTTGGTQ